MKRIAILVETSLASGREILAGIAQYAHTSLGWSIFQHVGPLGSMAPEAIRDWEGNGIIARVANPELLKLIKKKKLPTVDVLGNVRPLPFPLFKCDDKEIGRGAARDFLESAHKNFAFIGLAHERWSIERQEGFSEVVQAAGFSISSFHIEQRPSDHVVTARAFEAIKSWLVRIPTPAALMVASDQFAPIIFEACHQLERSIPEDISVIGVDNDEPFCNMCRPALSSIQPDHKKVGYLAAQALEQLMDGATLAQQVVEVSDYAVHKRLSSEYIAIDDPATLTAMQYIRTHATENPSLDLIAENSGLSRSVLQRRFKEHFNRTVGDVLLNEKLHLARAMLTNTNLPIHLVAERSGFNCQEYMNRIFKIHLKTTPRKYRIH